MLILNYNISINNIKSRNPSACKSTGKFANKKHNGFSTHLFGCFSKQSQHNVDYTSL